MTQPQPFPRPDLPPDSSDSLQGEPNLALPYTDPLDSPTLGLPPTESSSPLQQLLFPKPNSILFANPAHSRGSLWKLAMTHMWQRLGLPSELPRTNNRSRMHEVMAYSLLMGIKATEWAKQPQLSRRLMLVGSALLPQEVVFPEMLGELHLGLRQPDQAVPYFQQALRLAPEVTDLHKKLGQAYAENNEPEHAVLSLEHALSLLQTDNGNAANPFPQHTDVDLLSQLAQTYLDHNAFIRALYYFKEAARCEPYNPSFHSQMAFVLYKMDDIEGAVYEYKTAIRMGEDPVWTSTVAQTLGTLYLQSKAPPSETIQMFQTATQLNPHNAEALALLGEQYLKLGDLDAALATYWQYLQQSPQSADGYCYIGYILWQMDRNDEAIDAYLAALSYDPNHAVSYNNLGVIYLDEECNPGKALGMFETALNLQQDYTLACFNQGRALEQLSRKQEAAKRYADALVLNELKTDLDPEEIHDRLSQLFSV